MINDWAKKHNVSDSAINELYDYAMPKKSHDDKVSESSIMNEIRLSASKKGDRLWRNNVGALKNEQGHYIRFGLANESSSLNKVFKSSDLIGITKKKISESDVGKTVGIFTAIECKRPGWKYTGTSREKAQLSFLNIINSMGGIGIFSTSSDYCQVQDESRKI